MPASISAENYAQLVEHATKPVIIDVYASWCGPCQQMAPAFEELAKELGNSYVFLKLNVDEARDLSIRFGVTSVPTFLFIKKGAVVGKETGYMSKESLKTKISGYLG